MTEKDGPPVSGDKSQALLSPRILTTLILDVRVSPGSDNLRVNGPIWKLPSCSLEETALHQGTPRHANTDTQHGRFSLTTIK